MITFLFNGKLATETMLIHNVNDNEEEMKEIAGFIAGLKETKS
jgi:wyosine [tRNA(Phe)-imidazoG37] synthetase (radical SAM superfamily)